MQVTSQNNCIDTDNMAMKNSAQEIISSYILHLMLIVLIRNL